MLYVREMLRVLFAMAHDKYFTLEYKVCTVVASSRLGIPIFH